MRRHGDYWGTEIAWLSPDDDVEPLQQGEHHCRQCGRPTFNHDRRCAGCQLGRPDYDMGRWSQSKPSNWLKAADIKGSKVRAQISEVLEGEKVGNDTRVCLRFTGKEKGLVLNVGNGDVIAEAYGDDFEDWIGRWIVLTTHKTLFQGKRVDGLLVEIPELGNHKQREPEPEPDLEPASDDDIPF